MVLRHSSGSAPGWIAGLIGPFLFVAGLFAASSILFAGRLDVGSVLSFVGSALIAGFGLWLSLDVLISALRSRKKP
jgi:hypothetical protein